MASDTGIISGISKHGCKGARRESNYTRVLAKSHTAFSSPTRTERPLPRGRSPLSLGVVPSPKTDGQSSEYVRYPLHAPVIRETWGIPSIHLLVVIGLVSRQWSDDEFSRQRDDSRCPRSVCNISLNMLPVAGITLAHFTSYNAGTHQERVALDAQSVGSFLATSGQGAGPTLSTRVRLRTTHSSSSAGCLVKPSVVEHRCLLSHAR